MPAKQPDMFGRPAPKRRGQLMHVSDAGGGCSGEGLNVTFTCQKCGYESEWLKCATVTEAKRGLPCPRCNAPPINPDGTRRLFK